MMSNRGLVALSAGILMMCGCGYLTTDDGVSDVPVTATTGLALNVDVDGNTDVAGFRFSIHTCKGGEVITTLKSLEDLRLPGMIPTFVNSPFDGSSGHLFSDSFTVLPAGCYQVTVQPVTQAGKNSQDCGSAKASPVHVYDGKTTEIMLVSQCKGVERGGLDVIASLNHPPLIESLVFGPSKFVFECEQANVCVTASDPNGDPLEFHWQQTKGVELFSGPKVVSRTKTGNQVTECIEVVPIWNDDYEFKVTVHDLFYDDKGGLVPKAGSKDSLTFPLYANWDIELQCYDPSTQSYHNFPGVREIQRAPGCVPVWPADFYCSPYKWDRVEETCPDGVFDPATVYPICNAGPGKLAGY